MTFTSLQNDLAYYKISHRWGDFVAEGIRFAIGGATSSRWDLLRNRWGDFVAEGIRFAIGGATSSRWDLLRNRWGDFVAEGLASQSTGRLRRGGICSPLAATPHSPLPTTHYPLPTTHYPLPLIKKQ